MNYKRKFWIALLVFFTLLTILISMLRIGFQNYNPYMG